MSVRGGKRVLIAEVAKEHGYEKLKEEQLLAIDKFVSGKDVFVSLLTGFVSLLFTAFCQPYTIAYEGTRCQRRWL